MAREKQSAVNDSYEIKAFVDGAHDNLPAGEVDAGIQTARSGAEYIRNIVKTKVRAKAVEATQKAGADYSIAEAIVAASPTSGM